MKGIDVLGNIALLKFDRKDSMAKKKKEAEKILKNMKSVSTVLEKTGKFSGRLRTLKTKHLSGIRTTEAKYKENGCEFLFDIEKCYFSPRLSSERMEVAKMVKKKEKVLVLFAGVGPFAITIAKIAKPRRIVSVELGKECNKYALENVKRNKVNVEIVQGDVRKKLPGMKDKFDRIVMARPNLEDSFLDVTFPRIRKGGIVHYYGFCAEDELEAMKFMIKEEAVEAGRKIKIFKVKKAGDIGVKKWRYRIDIKVSG